MENTYFNGRGHQYQDINENKSETKWFYTLTEIFPWVSYCNVRNSNNVLYATKSVIQNLTLPKLHTRFIFMYHALQLSKFYMTWSLVNIARWSSSVLFLYSVEVGCDLSMDFQYLGSLLVCMHFWINKSSK